MRARSLLTQHPALHLGLALATALAASCTRETPRRDAGVLADGGGEVDGGDATDGGARPDGGAPTDGGARPDGGGEVDGGATGTRCDNPPLAPAPGGACAYTPGSGNGLLLRGDFLGADGLVENGQVLVGADGRIACAACDCSSSPGFADAPQLVCARGVISPALINAHDHITFAEGAPTAPSDPDLRYDHRHEWRRGQNGRERLTTPGNRGGSNGVLWGELRMLLGGATAINGSGGAKGLLRNLDRAGEQQEGLGIQAVEYSTFPLGDTGGTRRESGCAYNGLDQPSDFDDAVAYAPHIAEGIDRTARNEFLCLSDRAMGGSDVLTSKTAVIHGIGLLPVDYRAMAAEGASLVWSPRSNIDLYGHTAQVVLARQSGVRIALGSDWTYSGSMNMLRELRCAAELDERNYGNFFDDRALVEMATSNAAGALGVGDRLGSILPGREADLTIWDAAEHRGYRAVLEAGPEDVVLVLRSGMALHGDDALVAALSGNDPGCEPLDVCGVQKRVCVQAETGSTIATLRAAIPGNPYELFFCGVPEREPTCVPFRTGEFMGVATDADQDGDGVMDAIDSCPTVFNAARPLDEGAQADADGDMVGDACDPCPLQMGTEGCAPPDPADLDGDGVPTAMDNCPAAANPDQSDRDGDRTGDVCDACPDAANPNGGACPASIYDVKSGAITEGRVRLLGVAVTAVAPSGYFAQVPPGSPGYTGPVNSGVFVYTGPQGMKPAAGDRVDVEGAVDEFFGQKQITFSSFTVVAAGEPVLAPVTVASPADVARGGARAAELEGVLISIGRVSVTSIAPAPGMGDRAPTNEFEVTGGLRVNDFMYLVDPFPTVGQTIQGITGVLRFANEHPKLEPRSAADFLAEPELAGFDPPAAFVAVGGPSSGLRVRLTRPAVAAFTVALSSSDTGVASVPAQVTIAVGQDSAAVPVTAGREGSATLTASGGGRMETATLTVYGPATPRTVAAVTLSAARISRGGQASGTVRLGVPAAVGGTEVALAVSPAGLAMTDVATVTVPEGQLEGRFTLLAGAMAGMGAVQATVGASTGSATFEVVASITRAPGAGDLVITEVHYNPSGTTEEQREWVELHNPTADTLALDGVTFADNQARFTLAGANLTLAPGAYAVLAFNGDMATNGGVTALAAYGMSASNIRFGNSGDNLRLSLGGTDLDQVQYGAGWPGSNGASMCLRQPYGDNALPGSWSTSVGPFGAGDLGSPGAANDAAACP